MSIPKIKDSRQSYYSGRFIQVVENIVITDDEEFTAEAFQVPPVALIIPIENNEEFILVKQYRPAIADYCIEFPAGKIKKDESAVVTAKREMLEETGMRAGDMKLIGTVHAAPEYGRAIVHVFKASDLIQSIPSPEPYEKISILKFSRESLNDMIKMGEISDAKTIAAYAIYNLIRNS